jgi:hypothetical protein
VRLTANEFGVYALNAPTQDRMTLIRDMREAFESLNIGWSMWDFDGGFDLVDGNGLNRTISNEMALALGLAATPR